MEFIKNIEHEKVLPLAAQISAENGQVVSKTLAQNSAVSLTLFAFSKGEEIGTHDSIGDAFVQVLEGVGRFTVGGAEHIVHAGEALVMPAKSRRFTISCAGSEEYAKPLRNASEAAFFMPLTRQFKERNRQGISGRSAPSEGHAPPTGKQQSGNHNHFGDQSRRKPLCRTACSHTLRRTARYFMRISTYSGVPVASSGMPFS